MGRLPLTLLSESDAGHTWEGQPILLRVPGSAQSFSSSCKDLKKLTFTFLLQTHVFDENVESIDKENISKTHPLREKCLGQYPNFHACKYFIRYFSQHHHGTWSIF